MFLSWLHQWVKNAIPANRLNRRAKRTACRSLIRRPSVRPMLENLEERRLLTGPTNVQLSFNGFYETNSYANVGFQQNQVAEIFATLNGQPDTNKSDYTAQINWGDGKTSTGSLVYMGLDGNAAIYNIKGTHIYQQPGSDIPIKVTVTGPSSAKISNETAMANVAPMPSGLPGSQPSAGNGNAAPEDVQLSFNGYYGVTSYAGVGFQENAVGEVFATLKGHPDTNKGDITAQINWGDSSSWDKSSLVYMGVDGNAAIYLIKGTHTYQQTSPNGGYPIVVYVNGPDGTSISNNTASANVAPMPSGIDGTQPSPLTSGAAPENVQLSFNGFYGISAYAGKSFEGKQVAEIFASVGGKPDHALNDFNAQINWGDNASWYKGALTYQGDDGDAAIYDIQGSYTYQNTNPSSGPYSIVVYVNGPDGTSISNNTANADVSPNPNPYLFSLNATQWDDKDPGYDGTIPIGGGDGNYSNVDATGLPTGLKASLSGDDVVIQGTPTQSGTFNPDVTVTDSDGNKGSKTFQLQINAPVTLGPLAPTQWTQNNPGYKGAIAVTGGTGSYSNPQVTGLPAGLNYSLSGGSISITGTPTASGTFNLGVKVDDSDGEQASGTYNLTISKAVAPIALNPTSISSGTKGAYYDQSITASGGSGTLTVDTNLTSSNILPGLYCIIVGDTLTISGTPTAAGSVRFYVVAADSAGDSDKGNYTLAVNTTAAPISISPSTIPAGIVGTDYDQTITASGGNGKLTVDSTLTSSSLPSGMFIISSGNTLEIKGTPKTAGTVKFDVTATDSAGDKASQPYSLVIYATNTSITISPSTVSAGTVGTAYKQLITASGGNGAVTIGDQITSSTQPANLGLSFNKNGNTLTISGTPTKSGTVTFDVTAIDSTGQKATPKSYTLTVKAAVPITISPSTIPAGTVGTAYKQLITASGGNGAVAIVDQITSSTQPASLGLSFQKSGNTLTISGTPTKTGTITFNVTASDSAGQKANPRSYTLTVKAATVPITISPKTIANGTVGVTYKQLITASGGNGAVTIGDQITSSTQPANLGLSFHKSGNTLTISGTPTKTGTVTFTVTATDSTGQKATPQSYTLTVKAAVPITISPSTIANGTVGVTYKQLITASGGNGAVTINYQITSSTPPARFGLSFNKSGNTLTISGIPTMTGTITFKVTATDSTGQNAIPRSYTLTINPHKPVITSNPKNLAVTAGQTATFTVEANGTMPMTVQWQSSDNGGTTWTNIGGNNARLDVTKATLAASGTRYRVIVSNSAGSATSTVATLSVAPAGWQITGPNSSSPTASSLQGQIAWPAYTHLTARTGFMPGWLSQFDQYHSGTTNQRSIPTSGWVVPNTDPSPSDSGNMCYQFALPGGAASSPIYYAKGLKSGTAQPQHVGDIGLIYSGGALTHAFIVIGRDSDGDWLFAQRNGVSPVFITDMVFEQAMAGNNGLIRFVSP